MMEISTNYKILKCENCGVSTPCYCMIDICTKLESINKCVLEDSVNWEEVNKKDINKIITIMIKDK